MDRRLALLLALTLLAMPPAGCARRAAVGPPTGVPAEDPSWRTEAIAARDAGDGARAVALARPLAQEGDPFAQALLGELYERGLGVRQSYIQARFWYRHAALGGNLYAMNALGVLHARGRGGPVDDVQAMTWYRKAAEAGLAESQFNLGYRYANGIGVTRDRAQAVSWYEKAGAQGHRHALLNLGQLLWDTAGEAADPEAERTGARAAWHRCVALGDRRCATAMGRSFEEAQEFSEARRWYHAAAEADDPRAQDLLARLVAEGLGGPRDPALAVALTRRAADQGYAPAVRQLALLLWEGQQLPQDRNAAVGLLMQCARGGDVDCMTSLGLRLIDSGRAGEGVRWLRDAAREDDLRSQTALGVFLSEDTPHQDLPEARRWLEKAVARDVTLAQARLAEMLWNGSGGAPDPERARELWARCAAAGDASCREQLLRHGGPTSSPPDHNVR